MVPEHFENKILCSEKTQKIHVVVALGNVIYIVLRLRTDFKITYNVLIIMY